MTTMNVDELAAMMRRTFDQHVDGLVQAAGVKGITVMPSDKLENIQIVMMVSPAAYAELQRRSLAEPRNLFDAAATVKRPDALNADGIT